MIRTIITITILLNVVGLQAQKSNPRGIYHMVSITGKNGTEAAMFDQYKICTDSMTWMVSITETGEPNEHGIQTHYPYFRIVDNDHMVFNHTGEEPDASDPTRTRIFNAGKKGFALKWWSTSRGHSVFPENGWCTEQYESNSFSSSGKKIFDMLYSTKTKVKKDGLQGRWKAVGAIKMSGNALLDKWLKSGKVDLKENDYVPFQDKYAIIDDQFLYTAYSEPLPNQQTPNIYGYIHGYQVDGFSRLAVGDSVSVQVMPLSQTTHSLLDSQQRPVTYVFYRISNDRMIVKAEYPIVENNRNELLNYGYEIWEKAATDIPVIKLLTAPTAYTGTKTTVPNGLYRYVSGDEPNRIREVRDSFLYISTSKHAEWYRLCTDTINWNLLISDSDLKRPHQQNIGDNTLDYQPKEITLTKGSPASVYASSWDGSKPDKWLLFGCSENGFSERAWIINTQVEIWSFDKRRVTPLAKEVLDVFDGKIPYDANHPLYGTWEVEGKVLNPSETKIDSIMKGLCTDYVYPYIRNTRVFNAFTPQHRYTLKDNGFELFIDKLDSDGKNNLVTWESYNEPGKGYTIVYLNWTAHWADPNTLLLCRDKEELLSPFVPHCLVLKRKVGGQSLVNVVKRKSTIYDTTNTHIVYSIPK